MDCINTSLKLSILNSQFPIPQQLSGGYVGSRCLDPTYIYQMMDKLSLRVWSVYPNPSIQI
ncbi:MAG: hypothetical protein F6K31_04205 [Symploca sp. SIO2G7]|nr:hypothetical protein [Symploca sp. SIO2G7]